RQRLLVGKIAEPHQQVVRLVDVPRKSLRKQTLQLELDSGDRLRVEQLAQVLAAQQLGEEVAVEGQRLRAPLGQRLVALVHVLGDVREQQRRRERRGALGIDGDDTDLARAD